MLPTSMASSDPTALHTDHHDVEVETSLHGFLAHLLNDGVNANVAEQVGVDADGFHGHCRLRPGLRHQL